MAITQSYYNSPYTVPTTTTRSVPPPGPRASDMTIQDFREWLKKFDKDKDGRISRDELRAAIKSVGGKFSWLKSKRGMRGVDYDGNGYIDENEIEGLVNFAVESLGMRIATY